MKKWENGRMGKVVKTGLVVCLMGCLNLTGAEGIKGEDPVAPTLIETQHAMEPSVIGYRLEMVPGIRVDKTGKRDMSGELQRALEWVWEAGGGLLYLSAGTYRLDAPIEVPPLVGLRGDFLKPGEKGVDLTRNSVLAIYHGRGGNAKDTASITLDGSAGIDGFVIWYPEQAGKKVKSYAPAIRHSELQAEWAINTTSRNLYLVNAYHGIAIGALGEGTCIQLVKNVYGTPLSTGIEIWSDADIPRLLNLDFDPAYLGSCGLPGMEAFEEVARKHLLQKASAIRYHRTDGSELVDIRVRGYRIGLELLDGVQMENGHWIDNEGHYVNFDFRDCLYAVWMNNIKNHGTQFFSCHLEGEKSALHINNPMHGEGIAMFLRCTLVGGETAISQVWEGDPNPLFSLMFTECEFTNAVEWKGGTLSIMGSSFDSAEEHLRLGEETVFASLVGNTYNGGMRVQNHTDGKVVISKKKWNAFDIPEYSYRVDHGSAYHPERAVLFNVMDFGARPGDDEDDALAIQVAIDKAHADGGGYVLIPAGSFRIEMPITIRENVELRGVVDFWQHSRAVSRFDTLGKTKGSLLKIYHGEGNENGYTFLIEKDAGINGLSFHYPSQSYDKERQEVQKVFPWLFRLKGDRSYLKHIMASNPWRMVDGFTHSPADIYLGYLCGAPLDVSVHLGENESPMLDNIHFNSWYWNHVFWPNQPSQRKKGTAYKEFLDNWLKAHNEAFILAGTRNLDMYGCFQFCTWKAFTLKKGQKSGLGPSGLIINSGNDWAKFGLYAHANNGLQMVNMHFIDVNLYDDDADIASIYFAPDMRDTIELFQVSTWGTSPRVVWLEGKAESRLKIVNLAYQLYRIEQVNRIYTGQFLVYNAVRRVSQFPINFKLNTGASVELNAAFFPYAYTVTTGDPDAAEWIDRYGNQSPREGG